MQIETQFITSREDLRCILQNDANEDEIIWKSASPFIIIKIREDASDYTAFKSFFLTVEYDSETSYWVVCLVGIKSVQNSETGLMDRFMDRSVRYKLFYKDPERDPSMGVSANGVPYVFKSLLSMNMNKEHIFTIDPKEKDRMIAENPDVPKLWEMVTSKMKLKNDRAHADENKFISMKLLFDKEKLMVDVTPRIGHYFNFTENYRRVSQSKRREDLSNARSTLLPDSDMAAGFSMGGIWADFEDDGLDQSRRRLYEEW
jgi:hypothetical protein